MQILILLLGGVLALGLPSVGLRSRWRFWHSWIDNGLLPVALGALAGLALPAGEAMTMQLHDHMRALLGLAICAAGLLVGTQLRLVYLLRAGSAFLLGHSLRAALVATLGGLLVVLLGLLLVGPAAGPGMLLASAGIAAATLLASSQRPLPSCYAFNIQHRDIVALHIAPSGWWNLLALAMAGLALQIGLGPAHPPSLALLPPALIEVLPSWLWALLTSALLGLGLGQLATGAAHRAESSLFLLAVLALSAGLALVLGASPLLTGIVVGACFANVALGRLAMIERVLMDLEQPVVTASGFFGGLGIVLLGVTSRYETLDLVWAVAVLCILLRWLLRSRLSPTSERVSVPIERALVAPGASGVLILGAVILAPEPAPILALPLLAGLLILGLASEVMEYRRLGRRS